jgi:tetratricopeptide (TPR) repeat protein
MQTRNLAEHGSGQLLSRGRWPDTLLLALVLAATTVAVFWGVGRSDFVNYDDDIYVTENWQVQQGLSRDSVKWAFGTSFRANNWHPLTWLSLMADFEMFGMNPRGYHFVNLGLHAANAVLLFGFLVYCTRRLWAAWLVAALFALHPLHVESVAWVAERKDVLSTFFWFSAMWMYAVYARRPGPVRYLAVVFLFALGLLSKPMVITLPLLLLLLDYWPLERIDFTTVAWREPYFRVARPQTTILGLLIEKIPLLVLSLCSGIVTLAAQSAAIAGAGTIDLQTRLTNAVVSYARYLAGMFWPAGLAVFYPHPREPLYFQAVLALALLVGLTIIVLELAQRRKFLATGWLWYLLTLLPVIGLIQVGDQSHADRYSYVPLVGPFIVLAWLLCEYAGRSSIARLASVVGAVGVLAVLSILTRATLKHWINSENLCRRALAVTRDNYAMQTNLAVLLAMRGDFKEAEELARESVRLRSDQAATLNLLGGLAARQGRYEDALEHFRAGLKMKPDAAELLLNTGNTLVMLGRDKEAVQYMRRATEVDPSWAEAYALLAAALVRTGDVAGAAEAVSRSLAIPRGYAKGSFPMSASRDMGPGGSATAWAYLGLNNEAGHLAENGKFAEAEKYCRLAISLRPDILYAYYNLAKVLAAQGRLDEARETLLKAQKISPSEPETERQLRLLEEENVSRR